MDCIFCKIVSGEIPSYTIYEDDIVKVFLDINPNVNGHMLIISKNHYTNLLDIPIDVLNHINLISKKMYKLLSSKLNVEGLTLVQNNECSQEVLHYHLHLIPRYKNDNIKEIFPKDNLKPVERIYNKLVQK